MATGRTRILAAAVFGAALAHHAPAGASGFALTEHGAQGTGNAFAGGGAVAEDASAAWFNPASITRLATQVQASGHVIAPSFEFTDAGSVQVIGAGAIALLPTAPGIDAGDKIALVPNLYYVRKLDDRFSFGLAINAPFGLATEYDRNWKGRYQAIESEIIDLNVNPSIAYKVSSAFSIGAGVSVNYIDATLSNAIDFAAVCAGLAGGACPNGAVPGQGAFDGFVENTADDISFGFNLGLFYEPTANTRLSLAYRSRINHKLDGQARFNAPTTLGGFAALGPVLGGGLAATFANTGITAGVSLPETFSISVYHKVHPKVGLMGDFTRTNWSTLPELRILFDRPGAAGGPAVETFNWKDTWRFAVGANYYHSNTLTFRTGIAYDETPVPNAASRSPRLPDNDRLWLSFGASYRVNDKLSADVGYAHLFVDDTPIRRTGSTGNVLIGNYESSADLFSLQVNYVFD